VLEEHRRHHQVQSASLEVPFRYFHFVKIDAASVVVAGAGVELGSPIGYLVESVAVGEDVEFLLPVAG